MVYILLFIVLAHVCVGSMAGEEHLSKSRFKRQDEPWSWAYIDIPDYSYEPPSQRQVITEPPVTEENPCTTPKSVKPDFRAPGRRTSETKCYEYIWQNSERDREEKRNDACTRLLVKEASKTGHAFAIGGRNTFPTEFPHMGAIGWKAVVDNWIFLCGSSLISSNFVLTAAHCSRVSPRDTRVSDTIPKIVRFGNKNLFVFNSGTPVNVNITRIIIHPFYNPPRRYYDIALIQLERDVKFDKNLQPACLWSKFDISELGTQATLTGWGVKAEKSIEISPELQAADVDIIDSRTCDNLLRSSCNRHWCGVEDHQLCAGKLAGGVDACQGDSGGPLQVKIPLPTTEQGSMHYVFGVTAFGIGCARANKPGIYTRVSAFIDWIEENVWL